MKQILRLGSAGENRNLRLVLRWFNPKELSQLIIKNAAENIRLMAG